MHLVALGAIKLLEVNFGDTKKSRFKPRLYARGVDWAEQQNFFQISKYDIWQLCILSSYMDAQHLI